MTDSGNGLSSWTMVVRQGDSETVILEEEFPPEQAPSRLMNPSLSRPFPGQGAGPGSGDVREGVQSPLQRPTDSKSVTPDIEVYDPGREKLSDADLERLIATAEKLASAENA